MVYLVNDFKHLDNLYIADLNGSNERRLTNLNEALWKQIHFADVERFSYKSADDWDIDGFLVKPIGWQAGKKYPMILSIHGGPAGQYGVDWYHEFQVYAAKGYAVLFTNPRGSTGYGQKFERGIVNEWGGKDYLDIMNGVDAALKRYPWIDADRMGVTGGSYGGFMTNWIVGHTDRFKAAVSMRSLSDFVSDFRACDIALWNDQETGPINWSDPRMQWENSPIRYVESIRTPLLLTHGEMDLRCPIHQAEELFGALRVLRREVELVRFPEETHDLSRSGRPDRRIERLNRIAGWFGKYIPAGAREPTAAGAAAGAQDGEGRHRP